MPPPVQHGGGSLLQINFKYRPFMDEENYHQRRQAIFNEIARLNSELLKLDSEHAARRFGMHLPGSRPAESDVPNCLHVFMRRTVRKPSTWDECPLQHVSKHERDLLARLPVVETDVATPMDDFLEDTPPRECVVIAHGQRFYVNSEGYSYARYAFCFEGR